MQIDDSQKFRTEKIVLLDVQTVTGMCPITLSLKDKYTLTKDLLTITYHGRPDKRLVFERRNIVYWGVATESRQVPLRADGADLERPSTTTRS